MPCQSLFRKALPGKPVASVGRSHSHGDCPAYGTTCSKCGWQNHWAQQCRSSGRRNSSTGRSPSLGRPQNRQRTLQWATIPAKAKDEEEEETTSRDPLPIGQAVAVAEGGGKPLKTNALTVTGLSGSQHPPKVDGPEGDETKESCKYEC